MNQPPAHLKVCRRQTPAVRKKAEKVAGATTLFQVNRYPHNIETLALVKNKTAAERVALSLREAGVATHQYWVEDHYSFAEQLAQQEWDLVILDMSTGNQHVPSCILRYPDTPFVAISDKRKSVISDELLELGITDVASFSHPARLKHTLQRALREASLKREHAGMQKQSREQDSLLRTLLNTTDEAIAYIHEGVHSYVNPAYIRLFGLSDSATAIATPLLDLVAKKYQQTLINLLKEFHRNDQHEAVFDTHLCRQDGVLVAAKLHMSSTRFEGESVVQMIARPANKAVTVGCVTPGGFIPRKPVHDHPEPATDIEAWAGKMAQLLEQSQLRISLSRLNVGGSVNTQAKPATQLNRYQLSLDLLPGSQGFQSIERLLSESRRAGLLDGIDQWLVYNAASSLAKQLAINPATRYYVALQGDYVDIGRFAQWLESVLEKFDLPANSLNLILDGGGLSDNHRLNQRVISALKKLPIEIGISGLEPIRSIVSSDTVALSDDTLGFELVDSLPIDFALIDTSVCSLNHAHMQRLLGKCATASVTILVDRKHGVRQQPAEYIDVNSQTPALPSTTTSRRRKSGTAPFNSNILDLTVALP